MAGGCYLSVVTLYELYAVLVITVFLLKLELTCIMCDDILRPSTFPEEYTTYVLHT